MLFREIEMSPFEMQSTDLTMRESDPQLIGKLLLNAQLRFQVIEHVDAADRGFEHPLFFVAKTGQE